jgi:hypothetical protein
LKIYHLATLLKRFSVFQFPGQAAFGVVQAPPPHRTLPTVIHPPFGRSNSLGRSLPPLPCNNPPSPAPPLVRRRTFDDDDDQVAAILRISVSAGKVLGQFITLEFHPIYLIQKLISILD